MQLTCLTKENCEQVRQWRNLDISIYRTAYLITREMQEQFYNDVVCNRKSEHRYWAIMHEISEITNSQFIGMVGLCNISLENRNAEISIVIDPKLRRQGLGIEALNLLLDKGFNELNLENIYAETYMCNPDFKFWDSMTVKYKTRNTILANRKYANGQYWDSLYINFNKNTYKRKAIND